MAPTTIISPAPSTSTPFVPCSSVSSSSATPRRPSLSRVERSRSCRSRSSPRPSLVRCSNPNGHEQVRRELPEPLRHARRRGPAHQRRQEQAVGDVHAELPISLELLLVEELVERAL